MAASAIACPWLPGLSLSGTGGQTGWSGRQFQLKDDWQQQEAPPPKDSQVKDDWQGTDGKSEWSKRSQGKDGTQPAQRYESTDGKTRWSESKDDWQREASPSRSYESKDDWQSIDGKGGWK